MFLPLSLLFFIIGIKTALKDLIWSLRAVFVAFGLKPPLVEPGVNKKSLGK